VSIQDLIPMLNVEDVERSVAFYQEVLGFELGCPEERIREWRWASLRKNGANLMLAEMGGPGLSAPRQGQPPEDAWPAEFYFYIKGVEAFHAVLREKGQSVSGLQVTFYGMKEFRLHDPDGHRLCFGEDTEEPAPEGH
jgi:catechol 2,3-dioxygenase-like lactoylglutathione lyase family enzyme